MSNVASLAKNLSVFFFSFSPPQLTESEGQVGMEQSLQSRAHKASGHDPLACIKDAACN